MAISSESSQDYYHEGVVALQDGEVEATEPAADRTALSAWEIPRALFTGLYACRRVVYLAAC